MNKIDFLNHINKIGISFEQFNCESETSANEVKSVFKDEMKAKLHGFMVLNQRRTTRILKSYRPSEEIKAIVSKISDKQTWLIITENWCGDSAQNLPYIFKMTEENTNINFKIIYRDQNLEIMDKYLTNGGRAIPKIIAFNSDGEEMFQWGPRPEVAKQLVKEWKENGLSYEEFNEKLHLWYGKDRGKTLEKELKGMLNNI